MRKEEFVIEYERRTDNSKQIFAELEKAGYTYLGGGMDATVWGKDEGEVLKVLMPSANKAEAEASFLQFVKLCESMPGNPHVPHFVDEYSVFDINGTDYMQVTMERLQPLEKGGIEEAVVWALSDLSTIAFIKWRDVIKHINSPDYWAGFPAADEDLNFVTRVASEIPAYKKLFETMQFFFVQGRKLGLGWDLHTENVMQRSDGTIVITDPYFSR